MLMAFHERRLENLKGAQKLIRALEPMDKNVNDILSRHFTEPLSNTLLKWGLLPILALLYSSALYISAVYSIITCNWPRFVVYHVLAHLSLCTATRMQEKMVQSDDNDEAMDLSTALERHLGHSFTQLQSFLVRFTYFQLALQTWLHLGVPLGTLMAAKGFNLFALAVAKEKAIVMEAFQWLWERWPHSLLSPNKTIPWGQIALGSIDTLHFHWGHHVFMVFDLLTTVYFMRGPLVALALLASIASVRRLCESYEQFEALVKVSLVSRFSAGHP